MDTNDFSRKLDALPSLADVILHAIDVVDLYVHIPREVGLVAM